MKTALLSFKNVSYWYTDKENPLFQTVNIDFYKDTFYTITGTSGSGKTTFLSLAGGLDKPREGDIEYDGKSIRKMGLGKFRHDYVSIVFQSYNLIPYMTAYQNIASAMAITGTKVENKEDFILKMLAKVGISEEQAKQRVLTLSGGQQQRVAITRAFCCDTELIVADEPTGNLDDETSKDILKLFIDLAHQENKCVIMVTHDPQIAAQSDVNIQLSNGSFRILQHI
ncbi:putative ABC transport system ATP-binding protein [Terribacillus aidingensis]|uniref:Putative ABC transport system ATP-binding protein n=1 Tax=Terribacillus aidingensis TaxID=586416 RepID=A0A285N2X3_9BACI|nr:ABC transporter ATP-binding protein [Terribacillus aidingensis]SNZ02366.1 putative ABC transport system ATP-binding protein [Terribacillus aidingensis]